VYEWTPIEAVVFARDHYRCVACGTLGVPAGMAAANQVDIQRHSEWIQAQVSGLAALVEARSTDDLLAALSIAARSDSDLCTLSRLASELREAQSAAPLPIIAVYERSPRMLGQRPGANLVTLCDACRAAELERCRPPAINSELVAIPRALEAERRVS
jgi:hypothetical protein